MQQPIIIRYGELALKSNYVRRQFIHRLVQNIEAAFILRQTNCMIDSEWGRLYLYSNDFESAKDILKKIMGITSFSPTFKSSSNPQNIIETSLTITEGILNENTSFAVRAQRSGVHDFSSQQIAVKLGSALQEKYNSSVDLTNPDIEISLEIRTNFSYHFFEKIPGVGGLPLGSQGTVLCEVSNSSDLLAAWFLARRGCMPILQLKNEEILNETKRFVDRWFLNPNFLIDFDSCFDWNASKYIPQALVVGLRLTDKDSLLEMKRKKQESQLPLLTPLIGLSDSELKSHLDHIGVSSK